MNRRLVMGLYPNALGVGYAVFSRATNPLIAAIAPVKPASNDVSLERVEKLIAYFKPKIIVIQDLRGKHSHKSARIKELLNMISHLCEEEGIKLYSYSRLQIRDVFLHFDAVSKHEIAKAIVRWMPQYESKLPRFRKPWMSEGYTQGLFDAMSLVITYYYMTN